MTTCARPRGPDACTESIDLLSRGFSRGGIWLITWEAVAVRAAYFSSGPMSLAAAVEATKDMGPEEKYAAATICGTPIISGLLKTPPSTLQLATRGSRLNQTGCEVPPHGSASASSCWPGIATLYRPASAGHSTYW